MPLLALALGLARDLDLMIAWSIQPVHVWLYVLVHICVSVSLCVSLSVSLCESIFCLYVFAVNGHILMKVITICQVHTILMAFSRRLGQRYLVNSLASDPLKGFEQKLTQILAALGSGTDSFWRSWIQRSTSQKHFLAQHADWQIVVEDHLGLLIVLHQYQIILPGIRVTCVNNLSGIVMWSGWAASWNCNLLMTCPSS